MQNWSELIFSEEIPFEEKAAAVFEYQYENNPVYRRFCEALSAGPPAGSFPLLPIRAFKDAEVTCWPDKEPELVFRSSGTTSMTRSRHLVAAASLYRESLYRGFGHFYDADQPVLWAYTPGYSDNPDSSLVWMIYELIGRDESGLSRFLELDRPLDETKLEQVGESGRPLILFGSAFGLLDLAERHPVPLSPDSIVIETGGMKTHRREISREQLHKKLAEGFGLDRSRIHSEYGMTELLSQAYATGGIWFRTVPWMHVTVRNPDDPLKEMKPHQEGLLGVIDLANVHSCSFLLTGDRGVKDRKGRFNVLGRWNPRDLRGCNFLVEED